MKNKHYNCEQCANKNSILCEICSQVVSPNIKEHKPRFYVALSDVKSPNAEVDMPNIKGRELKKKAIEIERYLLDGNPIPIQVVMEYNELAEGDQNKE